jgi:hypothetical protein
LLASSVDSLVNAMAAFGAPSGGEITLTQGQRDQVNAIIAANWQGGGQSAMNAITDLDNSQSIGGALADADLLFTKSGDDPMLGADEPLTFADWYASTDNHSVQEFEFDGLGTAVDADRAATPLLTSWALSESLASFHLSGSDMAGLGADLANRYGGDATVAGISVTAAADIVGDARFGSAAQGLHSLASRQNTWSRLS